MLDYGSLSWDHRGKAWWTHTREVPCVGPAWSDKCLGHDTDDYGSPVNCPACTYGNGKTIVVRRVRVPRYDAPQPPKSWKGPGKKKIEEAYNA